MAAVSLIEKRNGSETELQVIVEGKMIFHVDGTPRDIEWQATNFQVLAKALGASVRRERHTVEVIP